MAAFIDNDEEARRVCRMDDTGGWRCFLPLPPPTYDSPEPTYKHASRLGPMNKQRYLLSSYQIPTRYSPPRRPRGGTCTPQEEGSSVSSLSYD